MDNWDARMMLDLYIHNYLIKKRLYRSAAEFAREARFHPRPVAIDCPEGFLLEWWSIFWAVFCATLANRANAAEASSSKAAETARPAMPPLGAAYKLQNTYPAPQIAGLREMFRTASASAMSRAANVGNLLPSFLSSLMASPGFRLPMSNFGMTQGASVQAQGGSVPNFVAPTMPEPNPGSLPASGLNPNLGFLNFDPLSCNSRQMQEPVYNSPQLTIVNDDKCGTSCWRSLAAPTFQPAGAFQHQEPFQLDNRSAGTGASMGDEELLGHIVRSMCSDPPPPVIVDELAPVLQSSGFYSRPQENKKPRLSVDEDGKNGASLAAFAAGPSHGALKAIKEETSTADTGSSSSCNKGSPSCSS